MTKYERPIKDVSVYEKLYRYCTTTRVHGKLYKEKLKELQQITLKLLRKETKK